MKIITANDKVTTTGLCQQMLHALLQASYIWERWEMTTLKINRAVDTSPRATGPHGRGEALDLDTTNAPDDFSMRDELAENLGDDYDVRIERNQIHIEWLPVL